jgi:hypothetical protein
VPEVQEILFGDPECEGIRDKKSQMPEMQEHQGEAANHSLSGGDLQEKLGNNLSRIRREEEKR